MPNCSGEGGIKTGTRFRAFAIPKISVAFLKPGAILIPLEVYMVNSPSRPNLCPVAPPSLGASVRHVFSLPHPGHCLRAGRGQFEISNLRFEIPLLLVAVRKDHQGRIKAKTPPIVPNQGKSRQTPYFQTAANHPLDGANRQTNGKNVYQGEILSRGERTQVRAGVITNQSPFAPPSPIKAKTPAIVPNQGSSRLIKANAKFSNSRPFSQPPAGLGGPADEWRNAYQGEILSWGRGHR